MGIEQHEHAVVVLRQSMIPVRTDECRNRVVGLEVVRDLVADRIGCHNVLTVDFCLKSEVRAGLFACIRIVLMGVDAFESAGRNVDAPPHRVGEPSFLLSSRRIADVYAGAEGARVLSLDESRLQRLVNKPSPLAAMLLLNLSKALARKMAAMRTRSSKAAMSLVLQRLKKIN